MFQWEATLVVLYETWPDEAVKPSWIESEIRRRDLSRTRGSTFYKTLRNCLNDRLSGVVTKCGRNRFRLNIGEHATWMYEQVRRKYPWYFQEPQQPDHKPIGIPSLEQPNRRDGQPSSTNSGVTTGNASSQQRTISGLPGKASAPRNKKQKKLFDVSSLQELIIAEEVGDQYEGEKRRIAVNSYERSRDAREACIREHGYRCAICKMSFEEEYGEIGEGYIHVHHVKPLKSSGGVRRRVNYKKDLIPICPNCHAMIHSKGHRDEPYDVDELRRIWTNAKRRKARRRKAARIRSQSK